jgi:hypothetical protein
LGISLLSFVDYYECDGYTGMMQQSKAKNQLSKER